jgi:hypothetical protein
VEKRAQGIISEVVVTGEAAGHLVLLVRTPFREKNGGVLQEEVCRGTGNPEM